MNAAPHQTLLVIVALAAALAVTLVVALLEGARNAGVSRRAVAWGGVALLGLLAARLTPSALAVPLGPREVFALAFVAVLAGVAPLSSPAFRAVVLATPLSWLVALHLFRLEGAFFLTLLDAGLLPAEFALPAGWGDLAVAALSLVLLWALRTKHPWARALLLAWNALGFADFATAFATGASAMPRFGEQLAAAGHDVGYLSVVFLVPTFVVPMLAVIHVFTLVRLWVETTRPSSQTQHTRWRNA